MTITLNDKEYEVSEGTNLEAFIQSLDIKLHGIAIAINYEVIPKNKWDETILSDKMELMLIQAVSGG